MIETLLLFTEIIASYTIELQAQRSDLSKTKIRLVLSDSSTVFLREIILKGRLCDYSYHWAGADGSLIVRWDNAAHYPDIATFPHHKHVGFEQNVLPSYEQNLQQVLNVILCEIQKG